MVTVVDVVVSVGRTRDSLTYLLASRLTDDSGPGPVVRFSRSFDLSHICDFISLVGNKEE